jgi:hypothetical protein
MEKFLRKTDKQILFIAIHEVYITISYMDYSPITIKGTTINLITGIFIDRMIW